MQSAREPPRGSARGAQSSARHAKTSAFDLTRPMPPRQRSNLQRSRREVQRGEHNLQRDTRKLQLSFRFGPCFSAKSTNFSLQSDSPYALAQIDHTRLIAPPVF